MHASTSGGLQIEGLHKSYGAVKVTNDLSFAIAPGEALGVIGPNGAGKSTLFNLITGLDNPYAGNIVLADSDITRQPSMQRELLDICRSYQVPQPFAQMTVFENLLVGAYFAAGMRGKHADEHCLTILEQTGLRGLADVPAGQLRLLDRKRLELARAMAGRPRLLLLDEIAGGLTDDECGQLLEVINAIHRQGIAIIWIEHVIHVLVSFAQRLLVLNFGSKLAEGEPAAVMADPQVRRVYMGMEA